MRTVLVTLAATALSLALPGAALGQSAPAHITRAVDSATRSAEDKARDADRKPAETLALAAIPVGGRVVELASFGHYWTKMLVEAVGPSGHVHMVDMPWTDRFGGEAARAFDAAHENATYTQVHYNQMQLPDNVDAVLNILFYHDLTRDAVNTADMNARIFRALKPGGIYLVIDHKAESGSGWRDASTLHRIDAATIRSEVLAAGFELAEDSALLANPADNHTLGMRDPQIRGHTDQAVLVFRKPAR